MFQNVSFRRKILLLPALAALGFLLVLGLVRLEGRSTEQVADRVEDAAGAKKRYRIVGSDETNAAKGWISVDSPVARALLGKGGGDVVAIDLPDGRMEVEITAILYG